METNISEIDLSTLLDEAADRVATGRVHDLWPLLEALAAAGGERRPGAAAALVDRDGPDVARMRAFGTIHRTVLGSDPAVRRRLIAELHSGAGRTLAA